MNTIGIITIHRIYNYGSIFQAYALQKTCEKIGYQTEIIDYQFPNQYHVNNPYTITEDTQPNEPLLIKLLYAKDLIRQHKGISSFIRKYQHLSKFSYGSPDELKNNIPHYDIYLTGSDQVWSPRHCNGDPAFMLHFAPNEAKKISYAASIGTNKLPPELQPLYKELLSRYEHISVRENSGAELIQSMTGKNVEVVLDPTLLLNKNEWNQLATTNRQINKKYILCYFLNYTFNAFPYVDDLANYMQDITGFDIVRVARPPHKLLSSHTHNRVGALPEEFLALFRDAEMVLTTSFHGTAFAVNYGKPVFTVVKDKNNSDSRQISLMQNLGLNTQVLSIKDGFPDVAQSYYDYQKEQEKLELLRQESMQYLIKSLSNE